MQSHTPIKQMRQSTPFKRRRILPHNLLKPSLKPGNFKFQLNDKYEVTLFIKDPENMTYTELIGKLANGGIVQIEDNKPLIQKEILAIKNERGASITIDPLNLGIFSIDFQPLKHSIASTSHSDWKKLIQGRPVSVKRKGTSNSKLDLLQKLDNINPSLIQPEKTTEQLFGSTVKFRLKTRSARKQIKNQSSQLFSDSFQHDSKEIKNENKFLTPQHQEKPLRKGSRAIINNKKFHQISTLNIFQKNY